jgi:mono/diheme cytochrome c family protein
MPRMHASSTRPMPKTFRTSHLSEFLSAKRSLMLSATLCGVLLGCEQRVTPTREWQPSDHGQPSVADPDRTPTPAAPEEGGSERAADALYNVSCAGCHGRDGRGQGPQRPAGAPMPNFSDPQFQAQRTDAQLAEVVRQGRGLMPPFGKQVNDQGIEALIAKVRRFAVPGEPVKAQ